MAVKFRSLQNIYTIDVTFVLHHRSQQFETEQAELHQKLVGLQNELAAMNQQYNALLEQVGQQHNFIQQLSEMPETQNSGVNLKCNMFEEADINGECNIFAFGEALLL